MAEIVDRTKNYSYDFTIFVKEDNASLTQWVRINLIGLNSKSNSYTQFT